MNLEVAQEEMEVDKEWVDYLSKRMYDAVMTRIPDVTLNGDADSRYPGNLNFSFAFVEVCVCVYVCACVVDSFFFSFERNAKKRVVCLGWIGYLSACVIHTCRVMLCRY